MNNDAPFHLEHPPTPTLHLHDPPTNNFFLVLLLPLLQQQAQFKAALVAVDRLVDQLRGSPSSSSCGGGGATGATGRRSGGSGGRTEAGEVTTLDSVASSMAREGLALSERLRERKGSGAMRANEVVEAILSTGPAINRELQHTPGTLPLEGASPLKGISFEELSPLLGSDMPVLSDLKSVEVVPEAVPGPSMSAALGPTDRLGEADQIAQLQPHPASAADLDVDLINRASDPVHSSALDLRDKTGLTGPAGTALDQPDPLPSPQPPLLIPPDNYTGISNSISSPPPPSVSRPSPPPARRSLSSGTKPPRTSQPLKPLWGPVCVSSSNQAASRRPVAAAPSSLGPKRKPSGATMATMAAAQTLQWQLRSLNEAANDTVPSFQDPPTDQHQIPDLSAPDVHEVQGPSDISLSLDALSSRTLLSEQSLRLPDTSCKVVGSHPTKTRPPVGHKTEGRPAVASLDLQQTNQLNAARLLASHHRMGQQSPACGTAKRQHMEPPLLRGNDDIARSTMAQGLLAVCTENRATKSESGGTRGDRKGGPHKGDAHVTIPETRPSAQVPVGPHPVSSLSLSSMAPRKPPPPPPPPPPPKAPPKQLRVNKAAPPTSRSPSPVWTPPPPGYKCPEPARLSDSATGKGCLVQLYRERGRQDLSQGGH